LLDSSDHIKVGMCFHQSKLLQELLLEFFEEVIIALFEGLVAI
jgi:hypothetical protein